MSRIARLPIAALAVLAIVSMAGCNGDNKSNPLAPKLQARVMAVHASPDAPAVDLLVDGAVAGGGLAFPSNTGYLTVDAGTRNVKVNVAGTSTTVINADLPVTSGGNYTVFANGAVASIGALVLTDDLTAPAAGQPTGQALKIHVQCGP